MRKVNSAAIILALACAVGCTAKSASVKAPSKNSAKTSTATELPSGTTLLDCTAPIDQLSSPTKPQTRILDALALDTTSTMQVSASGYPHRLFAKTPLIVRAGHDSTVTIPADWAARVSVAWGNHGGTQWTTSLRIPACPEWDPGKGQWLVYNGGFSLDAAACVPVEVRSGIKTATVQVSVGAPCPKS
jgi:hypothetical protein